MLFRCFTEHTPLQVGERFALSETASHHLSTVLRHRVGDQSLVFGPNNGDYLVRIVALKPSVIVEVIEAQARKTESPFHIHLYQGIAKNDRMDLILQKATELGASSIHPIQSEKVQLKLAKEKWPKKHQHWLNILVSASEQSGRCAIPELVTINTFADLFRGEHPFKATNSFFFDPRASLSLSQVQFEGQECHLFVGPESGWSEAEVQALSQHATAVRLGPRILRTETAAITVMSLCQGRWGDLDA